MILALDCESTGLDWFHGARPFYVTTCTDSGEQRNFRWRVDLRTREVDIDVKELWKINSLIEQADIIVGQNLKFDIHALYHAGIKQFPWHKVRDTLVAGHILASNQPHNITDMVLHYIGEDILPLEKALEKAVNEARRMCRLKHFIAEHGEIAIASDKRTDMPSAGEKTWRFDYWLPYELADLLELNKLDNECKHEFHDWTCKKCGGHEWWIVLEEYANPDSEMALALWCGVGHWHGMEAEIKQRGDWARFMENMEVARITQEMELGGVTKSKSRSSAMLSEFQLKEIEHETECVKIARSTGFDLTMPRGGGVNDSLRAFIFDHQKMPILYWTDGGKKGEPKPALNKDAMSEWSLTLEGASGEFIHNLIVKRAYSSAIGYLEAYDRFAILDDDGETETIHPNLNPVGTATTRLSSSNPNGQNVGKGRDLDGDEEKLPSVREVFGPGPGREWWALDYFNIEMMIPAYLTGEPSMVELFEKPNDAPYFGSYHILNASIIYPDLFWPLADKKGEFKRLYLNTWYKSLKNFGFAVQYDAGESTADAAAKRRGSFRAVVEKLTKITEAKQKELAFARREGIVRTLPDKTIPGDRGYPLMVSRYESGAVKATTPWNYKIQGTAGWAKKKAMIRCDRQLKEWKRTEKFTGRMCLEIHDELVFDFPARGKGNLGKINRIKELMEESGRDIGIPLRVSVSYHPYNWVHEEQINAA